MTAETFDALRRALAPGARRVVDDYLAAVERALDAAEPEVVQDTIETLQDEILESVDPGSDADTVRAVLLALADPAEFAVQIDCHAADGSSPSPIASGTVLGVPYEFRPPTSERIASAWWNPRDPRLLVPRVFGIGWSLNFGAAAVKLGVIEPDAEDEPFGEVPDAWFSAACVVPVVLTAFIAVSYLVAASSLPERMAVHWDFYGRADDFASPLTAALLPFLIAALPSAYAIWSVVSRRAPLAKGASIGLASFASAIGAGVWSLSLASAAGVTGWWITPLFLVSILAVPFFVFTGLARIGRAAEMGRDVRPRKGSAR